MFDIYSGVETYYLLLEGGEPKLASIFRWRLIQEFGQQDFEFACRDYIDALVDDVEQESVEDFSARARIELGLT